MPPGDLPPAQVDGCWWGRGRRQQSAAGPVLTFHQLSSNASLHFMALGFMAADSSRYFCALAISPGKELGHAQPEGCSLQRARTALRYLPH